MLSDITLGQYFPIDSIIHSIDPRVKIISTILFVIAVFMVNNVFGLVLVAIFMFTVIALSKVSVITIIKGVKPILFLVIFTALVNLFMTYGDVIEINGVKLEWWVFRLTEEGVRGAVMMTFRLVFLVMGTSVLTLTTSPILLTDAIERLLSPFKKIGLPAHELAMMMTIALRFIPTLLEETDKIMKAQKARGADFESGNLLKRAKALIPILVPLFISSFRRADDLAVAMECRCYRGGEGRTRLRELIIGKVDYAACAAMVVFLSLTVLIYIFL